MENKNIEVYKNEEENKTYINFIPYNRGITLSFIKKHLKTILNKYEDFVLKANGFNFDGLYETNKDLVKNGCVICDNITNKTTEFKP